ncbi:adenosylmethionine--8-amino-7-oxononanoate transaminase, partial [Candidatus Poribacteria bacterium]|nr:adenosylmethionine--8-amino-7-oxononanoate transaminase [Candidatus Poribacteria bacterium]
MSGDTENDGVSSWWTACHGYNHPAIVAAMTDQLNRMPHIMFGGLTHDPAIELADRLCAILPGAPERVFLSDSGSVAIEVAMKMAVQYWRNQGQTGRTQFISFQGGYHGDTMAAMSVSDPEEGMHQMFAGYLPEQIVVPLPRDAKALDRFDETLQQHRGSVAAVLIEPLLQAAGGMKTHDAETLRAIAAHAAALDIPLIADEIATGFGRTGTLFACEQAGVAPDIICVGKALTGGAMSLAATAANTRIVEAFQSDNPDHALMHGPTFMANPLACAAANASLTLFETEPRLEQVANMESHFQQALA